MVVPKEAKLEVDIEAIFYHLDSLDRPEKLDVRGIYGDFNARGSAGRKVGGFGIRIDCNLVLSILSFLYYAYTSFICVRVFKLNVFVLI